MDNIKPLMVGRNAHAAPVQEQSGLQVSSQPALHASVPPVAQPALAAQPTLAAQVAAQQAVVHTPATQTFAVPAPVQQAAVAAPQTGCSMYFDIKQVTKLELEMPWGFISEVFEVAFISSLGELVVAEMPPLIDRTNDVFVLDEGVRSLVIGSVQPEHQIHWRESISFRPDSAYTADDVEELTQVVAPVVETIPEPVVPKLEDTVDYAAMSRNQRKKQKKALLARGTKFEDLPEALRNA